MDSIEYNEDNQLKEKTRWLGKVVKRTNLVKVKENLSLTRIINKLNCLYNTPRPLARAPLLIEGNFYAFFPEF
jgi:hypothetical protein